MIERSVFTIIFLTSSILLLFSPKSYALLNCSPNYRLKHLPRTARSFALTAWARQSEVQHVDTCVGQSGDHCEGAHDVYNVTEYVGPVVEADIASPRLWLENRPDGAYTVIRCDWSPRHEESEETCWKVWGRSFHQARLRSSFETLAKSRNEIFESQVLDRALESTESLLEVLLRAANQDFSAINKDFTKNNDYHDQKQIYVFMVTFLWSFVATSSGTIGVQGHISTSGEPMNPQIARPQPINVVIATRSYFSTEREKNAPFLQNRQPHPEAKFSSWCRERRPLENDFLKPPFVGEIILAQNPQCDSPLKLLEGLTSNFFVLYKDGLLRTASVDSDGILGGFARQEVLKRAEEFGLKIELRAPAINESDLWEEVFLTSSIKLINPVEKVQILSTQANGEVGYKTVWRATTDEIQIAANPLWLRLYYALITT